MATGLVRGLQLRFPATPLNQRAVAILGPTLPRLARGWMPWLRLSSTEPMALPDDDWVRIRPRLAGICGTDLALLTGRSTPVLTPFAAFPAVMGHEVVGDVIEAGPGAVADWPIGTRVVVDPAISCSMRGLEPCPACRRGSPVLCEHQADGRLGPGILMGFAAGLPGAWSDQLVAHTSQLYRVPDALPDEVAALVEPLSVGMHAVLEANIAAGERVLVIGAGTIGLGIVASMTLLGTSDAVTVLARHPAQRELAARLGDGHVIGQASRSRTDAQLAAAAGARLHAPITGPAVTTGGFDVVVDAVGTAATLDLGLRFARTGGRIVVVGGPGVIRDLDWTLVWTRELRLVGSFMHGRESSVGGQPHTFALALSLLDEHPELPIGELVTHQYPLSRWRDAMAVSLSRRRGSGKVVFSPDA